MAYRAWHALVVLAIGTAVLWPRLTHLDRFVTADENRWQANVSNFTLALATGNLEDTYQQPHPGITTQWFAASTIWATSWATKKESLVIAQIVLLLLTGYVFARLWGYGPGVFLTALLSLNPVLIAHTRIYAMDSLLAIFCLLSLGLTLLWRKTNAWHYLLFSGIATALALLSKLPGILLVPFTGALLTYWLLWEDKQPKRWVKILSAWLLSFLITLPIVLPALLVAPVAIIQNFVDFFKSDDYQELHRASPWYYFGTLFFSSTILQLLTVPGVLYAGYKKKLNQEAVILLLFSALFIIQMSIGAKKGDRYILPVFLCADALVVLVFYQYKVGRYVLVAGLLLQALLVYQLHPYELAYINPVAKPFLGDRRTGWGEGLDLVADYLNQKPNVATLKVASYYPTEFAYHFQGNTISINDYDNGSVNYVVTYRAMFDRGADAWETDVLNHFKSQQPEKVISLNGIPYAWIYPLPTP